MMKLLVTLTIPFLVLLSCCKKDNSDQNVDYSTPPSMADYIVSQLGKSATFDKNGSAIKSNELVFSFSNIDGFETIDEKRAFIFEIGERIQIGLVEHVKACMCGDELLVVLLDQDIVDSLGGIENVSEKLKNESGGVVEVDKNFIAYHEKNNPQDNDSGEVVVLTELDEDNVTIAILDTGLDNITYTSQLVTKTVANTEVEDFCLENITNQTPSFVGYDVINGDNNPFDEQSHGTHIAGIISNHIQEIEGETSNSIEYHILPIRTHGEDGLGTYFDVLCGIYYAVDSGADVINCSWGFTGLADTEYMQKAIQYARDNDVIIVASMGNDGVDISNHPHYPSSYGELENVIAVGAYQKIGDQYELGNFGEGHATNIFSTQPKILLAPGVDIVSLNPAWDNDNSEQTKSGTSMSAAYITAVVAYELGANERSINSMRNFLYNTGEEHRFFDESDNEYIPYDIEFYYP